MQPARHERGLARPKSMSRKTVASRSVELVREATRGDYRDSAFDWPFGGAPSTSQTEESMYRLTAQIPSLPEEEREFAGVLVGQFSLLNSLVDSFSAALDLYDWAQPDGARFAELTKVATTATSSDDLKLEDFAKRPKTSEKR